MRQEYLRESRETSGWIQEQAQMMECGIRRAVEVKRKKRHSGGAREESAEEQSEDLDREEVKPEEVRVSSKERWTDMMS